MADSEHTPTIVRSFREAAAWIAWRDMARACEEPRPGKVWPRDILIEIWPLLQALAAGKIRAFLDGEPLDARYWSSVLAKLKHVETRTLWAGGFHLILAIEEATRSVAIVEADLVERFPAPARVEPELEPVAALELALIAMPIVDPEPEPNGEPVAESFEDDPATESVEDDRATPAQKEAMRRLQEDYPDGRPGGMLIKNLISTMVTKGLGERVLHYALKRLAHDYPDKWAGPRKRRLPH
jgi:hypothetical protein